MLRRKEIFEAASQPLLSDEVKLSADFVQSLASRPPLRRANIKTEAKNQPQMFCIDPASQANTASKSHKLVQ